MTDFDLTEAEDDAPERDPDTSDMFGAPVPAVPLSVPLAASAPYQVLARKYRPRTFEDLIGQEVMVRTLTNAFAMDRIAHAFMLTGVRGVGKTTTARLLARALNFETDTAHKPSMALAEMGRHCREIIDGRHLDVLELDAASRTGVDDMREILDGVRYAPVSARYKIYVIDEVHMLSKGAFNALLKTLEEPPRHAKFIFATTEIRKVPVTILSRCQRFDLRRVEPEVLTSHLRGVLSKEGAQVDDDGLALIARAAEGSVRDALSLLDQAIVQADPGEIVPATVVRDMLGLADRAATIALFEHLLAGRTGEAMQGFRDLYGFGADPGQVATDLLEHCHAATIGQVLGPQALILPGDQAGRLAALGKAVSAGTLARVWQILLKAHEEVRRAPDPAAALEMALIRLCYAASLPGPEEALKRLTSGEFAAAAPNALPPPRAPSAAEQPAAPPAPRGGAHTSGSARAPAIRTQTQPDPRPTASAAPDTELRSFADLIALVESKRDMTLKLDLERYIRPIEFRISPPVFAYALAEGAPANLTQRLSSKLREWTGRPFLLDLKGGAEGTETGYERNKREEAEARTTIEQDPFVQAVFDAFPGAEIAGFRKVETAAEALPPTDDEERDD